MAKQTFKYILIDTYEKDNKVAKILIQTEPKRTQIKNADTMKPYSPCGDFVIVDANGKRWGIERKAFLDAWGSLTDKRLDAQLAELCGQYPNRAILLLEAPTYFPVGLRNKQFQIRQAVMTMFNNRSMFMPCWFAWNQEHSAHLIMEFAKHAHKLKMEGRGVVVTINGS